MMGRFLETNEIMKAIGSRVKSCDKNSDFAMSDRAFLYGRLVLMDELLEASGTAYVELAEKTRFVKKNG